METRDPQASFSRQKSPAVEVGDSKIRKLYGSGDRTKPRADGNHGRGNHGAHHGHARHHHGGNHGHGHVRHENQSGKGNEVAKVNSNPNASATEKHHHHHGNHHHDHGHRPNHPHHPHESPTGRAAPAAAKMLDPVLAQQLKRTNLVRQVGHVPILHGHGHVAQPQLHQFQQHFEGQVHKLFLPKDKAGGDAAEQNPDRAYRVPVSHVDPLLQQDLLRDLRDQNREKEKDGIGPSEVRPSPSAEREQREPGQRKKPLRIKKIEKSPNDPEVIRSKNTFKEILTASNRRVPVRAKK